MNAYHRRYCASAKWSSLVEETILPWALEDVALGTDVLEVGPGFGATTRVLARTAPRLTALELNKDLAARLRMRVEGVDVVDGDGTAMPFEDSRFTSVVCFTMLHHIPSPAAQDRLFREAYRVLRPGGVFAGSDSRPSLRIRLIHLFDTMVAVDPHTLPQRLLAAGFSEPRVDGGQRLRFRAYKAAG
jgi:SAM-dependent methyltransferase